MYRQQLCKERKCVSHNVEMNNQGILLLFIMIYYYYLLLCMIIYYYLISFIISYYYLFLFIFIITSTTAIYSSSYHILDHTTCNPLKALINMLIPTTLTCYVSFCNAPFLHCAAICDSPHILVTFLLQMFIRPCSCSTFGNIILLHCS